VRQLCYLRENYLSQTQSISFSSDMKSLQDGFLVLLQLFLAILTFDEPPLTSTVFFFSPSAHQLFGQFK